MYSYFNFVFYITMQKHELLFWSKNIIKNILKPTVGLSKLIWSQVKYVLFVSKISRYIFASNIHIHLDNTFKFFSYTGVLCLRNSFESLFLKKTTAKQTNIKNQKKKLIHFLISDIRIIDIKKIIFCYQKIPQKYQNGAPLSQRDTLGRCWMLLKSGKSDHFCFLVLPPATGVSQTT